MIRDDRLAEAAGVLAKLEALPGHPHAEEISATASILSHLDETPTRSPWLAAGISALVPGSGQAYSGFLFDGMENFFFTGISGYAAYAGWSDELGPQGPKTRYVLPSLVSAAFLRFYAANLENAADSARRYNQYHRAKRLGEAMDTLRLVVGDDAYMLEIVKTFGSSGKGAAGARP
jgi:hypothetical protein